MGLVGKSPPVHAALCGWHAVSTQARQGQHILAVSVGRVELRVRHAHSCHTASYDLVLKMRSSIGTFLADFPCVECVLSELRTACQYLLQKPRPDFCGHCERHEEISRQRTATCHANDGYTQELT